MAESRIWNPTTPAVVTLCVALAIGVRTLEAGSPATPGDLEKRDYAQRGVDLLMEGDTKSAIQTFHEIQRKDPLSPLGYLLEAEAIWWKIYFSSAKLLDSDVFDVTYLETTPDDAHFSDLVAVAIRRSEIDIRAQRDVSRSLLYAGMAYALQARLTGLRGKDLATARAGKKMRTLLLRALQLDPSLTDAYSGLGVYNYLVGTLPFPIKLLQYAVALPAGSRQAGLEQLRQAAEKGDLTRGEAKFYLAKNLSRESEGQYAKSLEIFQGLARDYPRNPLWPLVAASLRFRLGQPREGEALYREVLARTAGQRSEAERAVHRAALIALLEQHPNEKFGE